MLKRMNLGLKPLHRHRFRRRSLIHVNLGEAKERVVKRPALYLELMCFTTRFLKALS